MNSRMSVHGFEEDDVEPRAKVQKNWPSSVKTNNSVACCKENVSKTSLKEKCERARVFVLGLSGKMGSGKSTLARALSEPDSFGPNYTIVKTNFGDSLKHQVAEHFGFSPEMCYTTEGKNTPVLNLGYTVGELLQRWGTALRHAVHDDVWVFGRRTFIEKACAAQYEAGENGARVVLIIDDVRFPNEADFIRRECGGAVVRLSGDPGGAGIDSRRSKTHESETALDSYSNFSFAIDTNTYNASETRDVTLFNLHQLHENFFAQ